MTIRDFQTTHVPFVPGSLSCDAGNYQIISWEFARNGFGRQPLAKARKRDIQTWVGRCYSLSRNDVGYPNIMMGL
jgi:hypothetical protein